jgi:Type I phosphodiesterase / nucleotide pyrophosphatase
MPRPVRTAVILTPTILLFAAALWFLARPGEAKPSVGPAEETSTEPVGKSPAGRLVVLLVFDQMRGDYPARWATAFGPDGFERVKANGVWYTNAHLPYAASSTGPGHASIATGAPPAIHGIVENSWFVRGREKEVYCVYGDEPYQRVPAAGEPTKPGQGLSPERLLVPTLADAVTTAGGKTFSLSLKDRAAVLMGGKSPTGAYCFDSAAGEFHTSSVYGRPAHPWVTEFNRSGRADQWQGRKWERLLPPARYDPLAGPDDARGEGKNGENRTFPHPLPGIENGFAKPYYTALEATPFGNEFLWEFAKQTITAEKLGRSDKPDLLCVSFSSNDLIGHVYGPDSHEVLDVTARSDRLLGEVLKFLDGELGPGRYSVVVTADHGVCPLPESAVANHPAARRLTPGDFSAGFDEALREAFGPAAAGWVEKDPRATWPWVYLNRAAVAAAKVPFSEVERYAENWFGNRDGALTAVGVSRLVGPPAADPLVRKVQLSYHPDRCGDVCVVPAPYVLVQHSNYKTGTNHGTPHEYDTHVPLFAYGAGVPTLGRVDKPVSSLVVAPLVAHLLNLNPPAAAKEPLPVGW